MESTEQTVNPKKLALNNALIWSGINIALFLVVYYVKPDLMGSFAFGAITFLIAIGLAVYFSIDMRKKIGGYWSFKEALTNIFILFFAQALIYMAFTFVFGRFIEPSYPAKMKEIATASAQQMMEKMGLDQDKIDEAMAESDVRFDKQFNPGILDLAKSIGIYAIVCFIGALIFAAIFKKSQPVFLTTTEE